ncbi:MAG: hypothetical protein ACM3N5_00505 [Candidatus Eiseniibacteriota bacterium]
MSGEPDEFQIGLVMAGAISAGAYTAGVMDFLLEALEAWEIARRDHPAAVPTHRARIRALSGASAGAMVSAILVRSLATGVTPVRDVMAPPDSPAADPAHEHVAFKNPFYAAWVQSIDIRHLLGSRDLAPNADKVRSVLDSTVLGNICDNVLRVSGPTLTAPPAYVSDPVDVFLTTVNLRGVPYGFGFGGQQAGYKHRMTAFADQMHFALTWKSTPPPTSPGAADARPIVLAPAALASGPEKRWQQLITAALSSGAFPIGLAPRQLTRKAADYDTRLWPVPASAPLTTVPDPGGGPATQECLCTTYKAIGPDWPDGIASATKTGADPAYDYTYWNVDGGLMDNEPLELVRRILAEGGRNARKGEEADRAVIMIDPFPNGSDVSAEYKFEPDLVSVIKRMFGALKEQARFKPEELELAAEEEVYSRFVISPIYDATVDPTIAIASAIMGGFGGFFAESFRRHDFQLGRRNCQRFLQRHFVLPLDNPIFDGWRNDPVRRNKYAFEDMDAKGQRRWYAPIVPLMDRLNPDVDPNAEIPLPARPRAADVDLATVRQAVRARVNLVGPRLLNSAPLSATVRWIVWKVAIALGLRGKIVDGVMAKIEEQIKRLG